MRITLKPGTLKAVCEREGISRDELARRAGVTTATAYRVDHGYTEPSPKFIAGLMAMTDQSFEELFDIQQAAS